MRIALAHSHPNTLGGGERALLALARGLAGRHDVRLLLGDYQPDRTYLDLGTFPLRRLAGAQWLAAPLRSGEVVVANSFGANLLALRRGRQVVYWVHSLRSLFLRPGARRPGLLLRRAVDFVAVRRAALLVANSHFTASRLPALYGRPADVVVYPGVDLPPRAYHRGGGIRFALSVGRLSPEKGLDRLLRAWRALPETALEVVGAGEPGYAATLEAAAPANVTFLGPAPASALAALYARAAVAVFAPYDEELGIAPLEAMAAGVPVVAWRSGGLPETVVDGQTGFLVDSEAALVERVRQVIQDPALGQRLGAAGRARAAQFTWQRTVADMERLCQRVAEGLAGNGLPARRAGDQVRPPPR